MHNLRLLRRLGVFQRVSTGPDDVGGGPSTGTPEPEDPIERFCLWVPIVITVAILRWVTKKISKRIKKCKGFWKIFCWIVAIIIIIILVAVLVIVTLVWWIYVCGRDVTESSE